MKAKVDTENELSKVRNAQTEFSKRVQRAANTLATIDDKIETIRWCDLQDTSGDIFPELDGYLEIKHIIWPNGYAKPF
jgi:hypothetical protein